jgi:hypothetical protein
MQKVYRTRKAITSNSAPPKDEYTKSIGLERLFSKAKA